MNYENPNSQVTEPSPIVTTLQPSKTESTKPKPKKRIFLIIAAVLLILALGACGAWGFQQKSKADSANKKAAGLETDLKSTKEELGSTKKELEKRIDATGEKNLNKDAFQSVFLKSGQVYFGKITSITENQITLEDIYYLRTNTQINPTGASSEDISLVKLGNELHGPEDKMFIERLQVDFWENLKNDGQVAKAIAEYKKSNP